MLSLKKQIYTLEEYLELDHESEERIEFWDGHVFTLAGASNNHDQIQSNAHFFLRLKLQGKPCRVFLSEMRVKVPEYPPYRYPDLSVYWGEGVYETMDGLEVLTNPQMIIEVLSLSTEAFDRGEKFTYYKSIPSFTEYLLVATNRPNITQFIKRSESEWVHREANGLEATLSLGAFAAELLLSEIYLDIEFPEPKSNLLLVDR